MSANIKEAAEELSACMDPDESDQCKGCRGWCCYRFHTFIAFSEDGTINWEGMEKHEQCLGEGIKFMRDNFVHVADRDEPASWRIEAAIKGLTESTGLTLKNVTMTCKAYDIRKGICTKHDTRPNICRTYLCNPQRDMHWDSFCAQEEGLKKEGLWEKYCDELPDFKASRLDEDVAEVCQDCGAEQDQNYSWQYCKCGAVVVACNACKHHEQQNIEPCKDCRMSSNFVEDKEWMHEVEEPQCPTK